MDNVGMRRRIRWIAFLAVCLIAVLIGWLARPGDDLYARLRRLHPREEAESIGPGLDSRMFAFQVPLARVQALLPPGSFGRGERERDERVFPSQWRSGQAVCPGRSGNGRGAGRYLRAVDRREGAAMVREGLAIPQGTDRALATCSREVDATPVALSFQPSGSGRPVAREIAVAVGVWFDQVPTAFSSQV